VRVFFWQGKATAMRQEKSDVWWLRKRAELLEIANHNLNAYVYDLETVSNAAEKILSLSAVDRALYAMKANFNADVLRTLASSGVDFDCVSPGEVRRLIEVIPDLDMSRILFTPNFAPREEYEWGIQQGIQVTLDNLYPLQAWPEIFNGQRLFIRVDPGEGQGHHEKVRTAGEQSKFGVSRSEIDELARLTEKAGAKIIGIHAHSGSGILDPGNWHTIANELAQVAQRFPDVTVLDLGGGIGVPEKRGDAAFDLVGLNERLDEFRRVYPQYELWLEPGRFLVSEAGVLLAHLTQVKRKGEMRYVGVSTGFNSLIRPALYDAYHEIINLTRIDDEANELATVVGLICETGDRFGSDRMLPPSQEKDVMLIANVGAYGQVMSSQYNLREVPPEIII
jgi:diaminopimelate decarboxylase/aspartate kinase